MKEGLRFNQNKIRYDLLEPFAIDQLAKVFTKGAEKYAPRNWEKGMDWTKMLASLKRHIAAWEMGEDFDNETNCYHMAHAAWNALALVSYYKLAPQFDDRNLSYLKGVKIGLDIDDVLADWVGTWSKLHNINLPNSWAFDRSILDKFDKMKYENTFEDFYINLPVLTKPEDIPFEPFCYVTSRPVDSSITEAWLDKNGFPAAPVYTVGIHGSKVDILKELKVDIFVDDKFENFVDLNKNGIFTYLFTANHNLRYNVGHRRINSLKELSFL